MVRCWYMDDVKDNPQDDHLVEEIDTSTVCDRTGVEIWHFQSDQILPGSENPTLIKLKQDRGYTYEDEINVNPSMENYQTKLNIFFTEHLHSDEEIRLVIDGSGFFDVRDRDDKWMRIHVFPGDLIILPAGIYHRFTPDKQNYIRARRLFVGEPVWTPINRPIGDEHPSRQGYVKNLYENDALNANNNIIQATS